MPPLPDRLHDAITQLVDRFKVEPDATPYDGLSVTDVSILQRLAASDADAPRIQQDVADGLGLPKTTLASAVRRLRNRGLVEQRPATDGRARVVVLTPEGRALSTRIEQTQRASCQAMLGALADDQERQTLVELLEAVVSQGGQKE